MSRRYFVDSPPRGRSPSTMVYSPRGPDAESEDVVVEEVRRFSVSPPSPSDPYVQPGSAGKSAPFLVTSTISKDRSKGGDEAANLDFSSSIGKRKVLAIKSGATAGSSRRNRSYSFSPRPRGRERRRSISISYSPESRPHGRRLNGSPRETIVVRERRNASVSPVEYEYDDGRKSPLPYKIHPVGGYRTPPIAPAPPAQDPRAFLLFQAEQRLQSGLATDLRHVHRTKPAKRRERDIAVRPRRTGNAKMRKGSKGKRAHRRREKDESGAKDDADKQPTQNGSHPPSASPQEGKDKDPDRPGRERDEDQKDESHQQTDHEEGKKPPQEHKDDDTKDASHQHPKRSSSDSGSDHEEEGQNPPQEDEDGDTKDSSHRHLKRNSSNSESDHDKPTDSEAYSDTLSSRSNDRDLDLLSYSDSENEWYVRDDRPRARPYTRSYHRPYPRPTYLYEAEERKAPPSLPQYYRLLHRVECANNIAHNNSAPLYQDVPELNSETASFRYRHLFGDIPVFAFDPRILDKDVGFVVFRYHSCADLKDVPGLFGSKTRSKTGLGGKSFQETLLLTSTELTSAMENIATYEADPYFLNLPEPSVLIPKYYKAEQYAPYPFLFHHHEKMKEMIGDEKLSELCRNQMKALCEYLEEEYGHIYNGLQENFVQSQAKRDYLEMLFRPNEVVINEKDGVYSAYVLKSVPIGGPKLSLYCWHWKNEGTKLVRQEKVLSIKRPGKETVDITSLEVYPVQYATQELRDTLVERGKKYWAHRKATYVTYKGPSFENEGPSIDIETRFMIDYATYRRLHNHWDRGPIAPGPFDVWPKQVELDKGIGDEHYIILPPNVHAFDIKEKEWKNLHIQHVGPIKWNKRAFGRLVLPKRTKDLVQSLVMVRRSKQGTPEALRLAGDKNDIITGKGNGLILLLHGGPGTGKTLTAESVAELAEMPLYSVTCGDIGTNAEAVEKYLQTILYLGKIWNCVLLLDEADVFLEERTLSDLERNSLVSVFLRTLEYYEGILILTSNRVGTFDEAFKSRIQVALHYPSLDTSSRRKIWQNFFDMCSEDDVDDVNTEDILAHLDELAEHEMNGRQIRNVLTTAWQIALFKKERMDWVHIEQSLATAEMFNVYLRKLQGVSDTDRVRDEKVRW